MAKKTSVTVMAAWIGAAAVVVAAAITSISAKRGDVPTSSAGANGAGNVVIATGNGANVNVAVDPKNEPGRLEVTDIFVYYQGVGNAAVEFRVTNRGELPVSISRVRLNVLAVYSDAVAGFLGVSGKYDLDISNLREKGQSAEIPVAQQIAGSETDRFSVTLTARNLGAGVFRAWVLEPVLVTTNGEVAARSIRVVLPKQLS